MNDTISHNASLMETKAFKKRFHMMGLSEKIKATSLIGDCVTKKQMPGGRAMTEKEFELINDLLEWCNFNIFFDITPRYNAPKL